MALTGSEQPARLRPWLSLRDSWSQLKSWALDAEHVLAQRLVGTVFLIRVASALLAFVSQVLFARWMGSFEFGIYVYVWTWVLLLGQVIDLGLSTVAQRFIPEYRERGLTALLRGFVSGSRWIALGLAIVITAGAAGCVKLIEHRLDEYTVIPLYLACVIIPAYALANVQEGIARSYDWVGLSMMPLYVIRQLLLTGLMGAAYGAGLPMDAVTAIIITAVSIWLPIIIQLVLLNRRLSIRIEPGPKAYDLKTWLTTALPILMVGGFYSLLAYTDVLVLQYFRSPDEVAVYYGAVKSLALVSFIYYSVSATVAHRFSGYHVSGNRDGLSEFIARSIKWTFWPSVAGAALLLALGRPILSLFGPNFTAGYPLMFILAIGLLARAAIGPIERLLNMLGEQRACALIYACAFTVNIAMSLALIPPYGMIGAASATTCALLTESVLLFVVTRSRLGFHVFVWGRAAR